MIALIDWRAVGEMPLGFLHLLPMLMLGRVLKPWQTALAAGLCMYLTEEFDTCTCSVLKNRVWCVLTRYQRR